MIEKSKNEPVVKETDWLLVSGGAVFVLVILAIIVSQGVQREGGSSSLYYAPLSSVAFVLLFQGVNVFRRKHVALAVVGACAIGALIMVLSGIASSWSLPLTALCWLLLFGIYE